MCPMYNRFFFSYYWSCSAYIFCLFVFVLAVAFDVTVSVSFLWQASQAFWMHFISQVPCQVHNRNINLIRMGHDRNVQVACSSGRIPYRTYVQHMWCPKPLCGCSLFFPQGTVLVIPSVVCLWPTLLSL